MFSVRFDENGGVLLEGRWDASEVHKAEAFFGAINKPTVVDFRNLEYISSLGLIVLLVTQKRLARSGGGLTLVNLNHHISEVFRYAGLNQVFEISTASP